MPGVLAESTYTELRQRFKQMNQDMKELDGLHKKDKNKGISTCAPGQDDRQRRIGHIGLLRSRGMQESGIDHNLDSLVGLLRYVGNAAVDKAKARFP